MIREDLDRDLEQLLRDARPPGCRPYDYLHVSYPTVDELPAGPARLTLEDLAALGPCRSGPILRPILAGPRPALETPAHDPGRHAARRPHLHRRGKAWRPRVSTTRGRIGRRRDYLLDPDLHPGPLPERIDYPTAAAWYMAISRVLRREDR